MMKVVLAVLLLATAVAAALHPEANPLERYIRAVAKQGHPVNAPITDDDILKALAVEAAPARMPYFKAHRGKGVLAWARATLRDYPILTQVPEQLHLSVTGTVGNVTILWTTSNESSGSTVCFWPEGSNASQPACRIGTSWTYTPISVVPWVGTLHGAHMVGLTPGQRFCYQVGDTALPKTLWSNVTCFACPDLHKDAITVAFGGDMGSVQLVGYLVNEQMLRDEALHDIHYDAFWLLGDIAYSTLDPGHDSNGEFFWDIFMRQEQPFVDHVPFIATYGNHDFSGGDSGAFINRFRNPQHGGGYDNFYFSYDHGPIRFVSMCTEPALNPVICDYSPGSPQYLWLEERFRTINRTQTPWLILSGHRPMYSSDKSTDSGPLQQYVEPLITKYKVDVQLTGHMHDTELIAPVSNNAPDFTGVTKVSPSSYIFTNPGAPVHVTSGILGAVQDERFVDPQPAWSLFRKGGIFDDSYGFVRLRANTTTLHFECIYQRDDSLMWELVVQKS